MTYESRPQIRLNWKSIRTTIQVTSTATVTSLKHLDLQLKRQPHLSRVKWSITAPRRPVRSAAGSSPRPEGWPKQASPVAAALDISLLLESRDSSSPPRKRSLTPRSVSSGAPTSASSHTTASVYAPPGSVLGGPVAALPAFSSIDQRPDPYGYGQGDLLAPRPYRQPYPGQSVGGAGFLGGIPTSAPAAAVSSIPSKRAAPASSLTGESPAKKLSKWSPEEDALNVELRGGGMKWEDISKRLPGRSAISCRLRYQNYIERRAEWDEEKKNKLARLYAR